MKSTFLAHREFLSIASISLFPKDGKKKQEFRIIVLSTKESTDFLEGSMAPPIEADNYDSGGSSDGDE